MTLAQQIRFLRLLHDVLSGKVILRRRKRGRA